MKNKYLDNINIKFKKKEKKKKFNLYMYMCLFFTTQHNCNFKLHLSLQNIKKNKSSTVEAFIRLASNKNLYIIMKK